METSSNTPCNSRRWRPGAVYRPFLSVREQSRAELNSWRCRNKKAIGRIGSRDASKAGKKTVCLRFRPHLLFYCIVDMERPTYVSVESMFMPPKRRILSCRPHVAIGGRTCSSTCTAHFMIPSGSHHGVQAVAVAVAVAVALITSTSRSSGFPSSPPLPFLSLSQKESGCIGCWPGAAPFHFLLFME